MTPALNVPPGTIFHMDNIHALRGINSSTIDLIATDPPFNTGRNREAVGGKYPDQWLWNEKFTLHGWIRYATSTAPSPRSSNRPCTPTQRTSVRSYASWPSG